MYAFRSRASRRAFLRRCLALAMPAGAVIAANDEAPASAQRVSPTEDLMREHGILNRILIIYDEALRRIDTGADVPPEAIRDSAQIVRSYVEDYHEKLEEDYIFPRFKESERLARIVEILLEQHLAGRHLTDVTLRLATRPALQSDRDRLLLANSLRNFIRMYHPHEAHEDTVIFPAFRSLVTQHEFDALREDFEKREKEIFGGDSFPGIAERVAAIEKKLGLDDLSKFTPAP